MQDPLHNPKLTLVVASIAHSFSHMFMLLYATVVLVINNEFNLTYSELQWLSVPGFVMFGLAAFPAGWLGDRWSATGMLVIFFLGLGFSAILTGLSSDRITLLVGLTLIGTFGAIYHPVGIAWLVKHSKNRGRALGINGVFGNIGTASAAIISGFLADFFGWRYAFFVPGILSLFFGCLLLLIISKGFLKDVSTDAISNPETSSSDLKRAFFALFISVIMLLYVFSIMKSYILDINILHISF